MSDASRADRADKPTTGGAQPASAGEEGATARDARAGGGPPAGARGLLVVPRWMQLALLPVLLIIGWLLLVRVGEAVFIFIVATLLALALNPFVRALQRARVPRPLAVAAVYLVAIGVIAGAVALVIPPLVHQLRSLLDALPGMAQSARAGMHALQRLADRFHLHVNVSKDLQSAAKSVATYLLGASRSLLGIGVSVARTITITFIIVVISIYMLLDARRIGRFVVDHFPTGSRADGYEYLTLTQNAVLRYLQAQILLSAAIGTGTGLTMWVLGLTGVFPSGSKYAVAFGAWAGVTEVIPYLGPVLGAVPPVIVALLHAPLTAVWVVLAYVGIQEIEGHVAAPLIMGTRFRVHPLVVIFALLIGNQLHGIVGMLVAVPLIPLARESWVFFRGRVRFEGWKKATLDLLDDDQARDEVTRA
jgi:predicted PurR-regulated permease PerM